MPDNSQIELRSWQKRLDALQSESVSLRHKITELLKKGVNAVVLERIEFYLNMLLDKDAVLALLRHEIAIIQSETYKTPDIPAHPMTDALKERLARDIEKMELEFQRLRADFTNYVNALTTAI